MVKALFACLEEIGQFYTYVLIWKKILKKENIFKFNGLMCIFIFIVHIYRAIKVVWKDRN